jgi:succinoglycan biosynthesis protein ExoO
MEMLNPRQRSNFSDWPAVDGNGSTGDVTGETAGAEAPPMARPCEPDVSFIVASYNAARYIRQAIASGLRQTGVLVEIIVVDDASSDGTAEIVKALAGGDGRIVLIRRDINAGPSAGRNAAVERATGRWIAILDADDLVAPERTRSLIDLAVASGADIVADNFERFQYEGEIGGATMIPRGRQPYAFTVDPAGFLTANCAFASRRIMLGAVKGMFSRDFLRHNSLAHRESVHFSEDFLFLLECLLAGAKFVVSSEAHYKYRMHPNSQSWRLSSAHLRPLFKAIADLGLEERLAEHAETRQAGAAYMGSLRAAFDFTRLVEALKERRLSDAAGMAAACPAIWPHIVRFGSEAVFKRLKSSLPGSSAKGKGA